MHHLTWAGVRAPTFLGTLGVPLIIGPVGGGETSPSKLRDRFPLRGRVLEGVRDLSNATIELNPIVRQGLRNAGVIFARTADTKNLLSPPLRAKTYVQMELGVTQAQIGAPRPMRETPRKLLYAGRLLYWKGVHIAVEAMSRLVAHMPDAHLTIVGNGPEETRLKSEIAATEPRSEHHARVLDAAGAVSTSLRHATTFSSSPVCTTARGGWFWNRSAGDCRSRASISADRRRS